MSEILLTRHAKSYANNKNSAVFGNAQSELDSKGVVQALALAEVFERDHRIVSADYDDPVLTSEFTRAQQTAALAGFRTREVNPIINELEVDSRLLSGRRVVEKHAEEHWIPDELRDRAERFVGLVRDGKLEYKIFFAHGLFIASVLEVISEEHTEKSEVSPHKFDPERGYIPKLATITPVVV